jgi:hypothetical protein
MLLRIFTVFLLVLLFSSSVRAQQQSNGCIDSLQIRYGYYCDPYYDPVCGCNNITYRNLCYAQNEGVIAFSDGICEPIAIDFNPNPVSDVIYVTLILKEQGGVNFWIYDYWGSQYYFQSFSNITEQTFTINVNVFPQGVYALIAVNDKGEHVAKKMVKFLR